MISIKRLETIEISGESEKEVNESIERYLKSGYKLDMETHLSDVVGDVIPYFAYVTKDDFC